MTNRFLTLMIMFLTFGCKILENKKSDYLDDNKQTTKESKRFSYYKLISEKMEIIEVKNIVWAVTDRPNFITVEDYKKNKNNENLVDFCFYLDTKNDLIQNFSPEIIKDLENGKAVRFFGKYYKTKMFDDIYPNKTFEFQRTSSSLSFEPKDQYFKVFVYEKIEKIK